MTIDGAIDRLEDLHFEQDNWEYGELTEDCLLNREALRLAIDTMRKYQLWQDAYLNRLKADLKAILVELQLEIEEIKPLEPTDDEDWQYGCFHGLELMQDKCLKLIQQKINSLKEA